jgi:hypothetical protein
MILDLRCNAPTSHSKKGKHLCLANLRLIAFSMPKKSPR